MFNILHNGILLGTSRLEAGDPPQACAEGDLIPSDNYKSFLLNVPPEDDPDPGMLRWIGLTATLQDGTVIQCIDVVLFDMAIESDLAPTVDVLGILKPKYDELFPGRYEAYENHSANLLMQRESRKPAP